MPDLIRHPGINALGFGLELGATVKKPSFRRCFYIPKQDASATLESFIETLEITHWSQWAVLALRAFAIGLAKTGLPGVGILVVPLLAMIFPAKASVGLLLPILIFADVFAVVYYHHHARWGHLVRLIPWAVVGIVAGYFILQKIDSQTLKLLIGIIVLVMLGIRFRSIIRDNNGPLNVVRYFAPLMGFFAGLTTILANAAGPVMILYFLAMRFDKKKFIGTAAWYYFIVNWIKVPFMANLEMITRTSLKMDVMVFPAVAVGAVMGIWLLKYIPQRLFNIITLILAAAAAIKLLEPAIRSLL